MKNALTADGRVKLPVSVTKPKVEAIKALVEKTMSGSRVSKGMLEEVLTSSDAIFAYSHLTNLNFLPQYDEAPRTWTQIADVKKVSDFRKPTLYSLFGEWEGSDNGGITADGVAAIVPEGAPYAYATLKGDEAQSGGIAKRGFKTDFTFEAFINDSLGFISALPGEMLRVALDTEEYEVYAALIQGVGAGQQLAGGALPEGGTVVAKAPLSRKALIRAKLELSQRKVNGRLIVVNGGFNLIVPVGQGDFIKFWLNQAIAEIADGTLTMTVQGYNPLADITVIESEYVTGTAWYLVPKPGSTRRSILSRGELIGHEAPELRVEDATGNYVGGSSVSPFEGSFSNDSATFRLRLIGGGILWNADHVIWSDGTGA